MKKALTMLVEQGSAFIWMLIGIWRPSLSRMEAHRTALPEAPHLALVILTGYASTLEKVIHGVLTLRGKRTEGTGGTEWFTTTIGEIEAIYRSVLGEPVPSSS